MEGKTELKKAELEELKIENPESLTDQIEVFDTALEEMDRIENDALTDEKEITERLLTLGASEEDISVVIARLTTLDGEIKKAKQTTYENTLDKLDTFYQENFSHMGKAIIAEFRMRPIYKKYIKLDRESFKIYLKGEKLKKKLKKKDPNIDPEVNLNSEEFDPYRIRNTGLYGGNSDIFQAAEEYQKIPEFVKKYNYNETNIQDLQTYQQNYKNRRYKHNLRGLLTIHEEDEHSILSRLYAIQLNQIREKLKENDSNIKENLDVYFQPSIERYISLDHSRVYSKKNAGPDGVGHITSVVSRVQSFVKALTADNIILSDAQKKMLREKTLDIFEKNEDDVAAHLYELKDVLSFIELCDFSNEQKKMFNSVLFNSMLRQRGRHSFRYIIENPNFPYTEEQIEKIFKIVEQSNITSGGIRIPYGKKENEYNSIGNDMIAKFPFTASQKEKIGEAVVNATIEELSVKANNGDFAHIMYFEKENTSSITTGLLNQAQFEKIVKRSQELFLVSAKNYIQKFKGFTMQGVGGEMWSESNFDIAATGDLIKCLQTYPEDKDKVADLLAQVPWKDSILKMLDIQKRPRRAEYDPWVTDITPLVKQMMVDQLFSFEKNGVLSLENPKDGEVVYEYVKKVGPKNLPNYFRLFQKLQKTASISELPQEVKDDLKQSFKIDADDLCKNDPTNLNLIVNEIEKIRTGFSQDLINENFALVDKTLASSYGKEFLMSVKGASGHSQGGDIDTVMKKYKETLETNPEVFTLPVGYEKINIEVSEYASDTEVTDIDIEKEVATVLSNPDLINYYSKVFKAVESFRENTQLDKKLSIYNTEIEKAFQTELNNINQKIDEEKAKEDKNDKAIENLGKRKLALGEQIKNFDFTTKQMSGEDLPKVMEVYSSLVPDTIPQKQEVLMELSLRDMEKRFPDQFAKINNQNLVYKVPSADSISIFNEFVRSHVGEHYLNKKHGEGDAIKTSDKNLIKYLKKAWGSQDFEKGILAITDKRIGVLERGELSDTKKVVTLIPSKGMQRIFSGDLGGACTSRRNLEFAEGKYQNIVSYSLILNKDTQKEKLAGSFLLIEAQTEDKQPILIVRANNPSQNLANMIDSNELVGKILDEARNVAKRRNIPLVGVAYNQGSASNRTFVADYYHKTFATPAKVQLEENEETKFNGYEIFKKEGQHPTVLI